MRDIRTIKEIVEDILKNKPETRDNDCLLVIEVWKLELINLGYHPTLLEIKSFYELYSNSKLSNSESITRCRRKIQEHNINLRGKLFGIRHNFTDEVKNQVKTFFPKEQISIKISENKLPTLNTNKTLKKKIQLNQQSFLDGLDLL